METEMLYRILETVTTFYSCHRNEISEEYVKDLDEQSKALLVFIKNQERENEKETWIKYTNSKYFKRYFKEIEFKKQVHNLSNKQLLQFWNYTKTSTETDGSTACEIVLAEIAKRFPVEYNSWINNNNPNYTDLEQYVLHSKNRKEEILII